MHMPLAGWVARMQALPKLVEAEEVGVAEEGPGNSPAEVVVAHHAFLLAEEELASSPEAQEVVRDHLGLDSALPKTEVSIRLPRKILQQQGK